MKSSYISMDDNSLISSYNSESICCPILCWPTAQRPHNILRTLHLFDVFISGLGVVLTLVDLKDEIEFLVPRLIVLVISSSMFVHSMYMMMYYRKMVSEGTLIPLCKKYYFSRL